MPSKSIFLIGPGFLGWTLLETLSSTGFDDITTLVRREEHGEAIRKITSDKIKIVFGGLNDTNLITQVVAEHDIIFHTATADHLPSANAVLKGIGKRSEEGLKTIYIHTSGASLLDDRSISAFKSSITFTDTDPTAIDALDIKQPHREIDLAIATFSRKQEGNNVKIAIMIPPLVYGYNPAHDRLTIQIPCLTRFALKHGFAGYVGAGLGVSGAINVVDLSRGFLTILQHLLDPKTEASTFRDNPYVFVENGVEYDWKEVAEQIGKSLKERGLIESAQVREIPRELWGDLIGEATPCAFGLNARSRADRLRALGWVPKEKGMWDSWWDDELPALLRHEGKA